MKELASISASTLESQTKSHADIYDKFIAVLAVKDPIAFQQVQAMSTVTELSDPIDLSPQAETHAWLSGQKLTDFERRMIREAGC